MRGVAVPAECTVVVDEAHIDFVDRPGFDTAAGLVKDVPNVIVLRTFSKIRIRTGLLNRLDMSSHSRVYRGGFDLQCGSRASF